MRPISFEVDGFPEFLRSEGACRRAIDRGAIAPETHVVIYGDAGEREQVSAADHPLLRRLFGFESAGETEPLVEPTAAIAAATVVALARAPLPSLSAGASQNGTAAGAGRAPEHAVEPARVSGRSRLRDLRPPPRFVAAIAVLAATGCGYLLWPSGDQAPAEAVDVHLGDAPQPTAPSLARPLLAGEYRGRFADQEIVLTIPGAGPVGVAAAHGTIAYHNLVNGGSCAAAFRPAGAVGPAAADFAQSATPGQPTCARDIPLTIEVAGESADGVAEALNATWHAADTGQVLMAGRLDRTARP